MSSGLAVPVGPRGLWVRGDRSLPGAVAHRGPARVVLALRAARLASAISVSANWMSSGRSGNAAASGVSARRTVGTVFMAVPYSFVVVFLVVHPKTYHPAGLR